MKNRAMLSRLYLILIFIILYLPIIYLIFYSFNAGESMTEFSGWSLVHYRSLFEDRQLLLNTINTLIVALLSALIATMIGTFGAISIYFIRTLRRKDQILTLNNILLVMPDVLIGASFLILFTQILPLPFGFWTVLTAHIAFNIPIVVLMVMPRLYELQVPMLLAAADLGASDWQILTEIILPNIASGIWTGFFMAMTYSLDDFAVTFFVTGSGFSTLSLEIYTRARRGIDLEINALSTLFFVLSFVLVLGYYHLQTHDVRVKKEGGYD